MEKHPIFVSAVVFNSENEFLLLKTSKRRFEFEIWVLFSLFHLGI